MINGGRFSGRFNYLIIKNQKGGNKMKEKELFFHDLILDSGKLIRIECPTDFEDQFYESIYYAIERGEVWATGQFDGCKAEYFGTIIDRINMKKIVGSL
jgi:hypothetical protein